MSDNPFQTSISAVEQKLTVTRELLSDPDMTALAQDEVVQLEAELTQLHQLATDFDSQQNEISAVSGEPGTDITDNCTMELRGGAGGDEAKLWAGELLRMYVRFAEMHKLKYEFIDDLIMKFTGGAVVDGTRLSAYDIFKYESGVHRVQRVPVTEAAGRIHTSTATVAVLPEVREHAIVIKDEQLDWQFMRAGGAGGQNVNKVNSAVRLTHLPTGIVVVARQEKQQQQNRKIALDLLRAQLWDIQEEEKAKRVGVARSLIGRAQRTEKIRTFNFPQNRVTDHRTKQSWYSLETMLEGEIGEMLLSVRTDLENPNFDPANRTVEADE